MTDNEIVKALECCIEFDCKKCSYDYWDCGDKMLADTLDLINRLQAENKGLSAEICGQKEANLFLINDKENAINGAIKKFCDILKKRINNEPLVFFEQRHIVYGEIDNLLKEMAGE